MNNTNKEKGEKAKEVKNITKASIFYVSCITFKLLSPLRKPTFSPAWPLSGHFWGKSAWPWMARSIIRIKRKKSSFSLFCLWENHSSKHHFHGMKTKSFQSWKPITERLLHPEHQAALSSCPSQPCQPGAQLYPPPASCLLLKGTITPGLLFSAILFSSPNACRAVASTSSLTSSLHKAQNVALSPFLH